MDEAVAAEASLGSWSPLAVAAHCHGPPFAAGVNSVVRRNLPDPGQESRAFALSSQTATGRPVWRGYVRFISTIISR